MSDFVSASKLSTEAAQQLSMNQDFTVMADWDCPLSSFKGGRTAAKHVSSCHHRQLSLHCLQATALAPRLLLLCTQKSSVAAIGGKVAEYCQHVDGLLQDEEQIGEACELSTCGWNMSQSAFKATLQTFCALDADDAQTTSEWYVPCSSWFRLTGLVLPVGKRRYRSSKRFLC